MPNQQMARIKQEAARLKRKYELMCQHRKIRKCLFDDWMEWMFIDWHKVSPAGRRAVRALMRYFDEPRALQRPWPL